MPYKVRKSANYLAKWRDEYWIVYISVPFSGLGGLSGGDRPSSAALGFTNRPHGPYARFEDQEKPYAEQRRDRYVDSYSRRLNRQMISESTLYLMRWCGIPETDPKWAGPGPHGDRVALNIDGLGNGWRLAEAYNALLADEKTVVHPPRVVPKLAEHSWAGLRAAGWDVLDEWRDGDPQALGFKPIDELELIEIPWPQDMVEGIND